MKYLLCGLLGVIFGATVAFAQPKKNDLAEIKFEKTSFDFGSVKEGSTVVVDFKFVNIGKEPLVISNANSSGNVVAEYPKESINPGKTGIVKVTLQTYSKSSKISRIVTVNSNSIKGSVVLTVTGNVEATNKEPQRR